MILEYINAYSAGVIALWATWCILSGKVRDGVLGKIIYAVIALSGYAIMARSERAFFSSTIAGTTLYVSLTLAGARHWFMVTYWPKTMAWLCRTLKCDQCLYGDNRTSHEGQRKL
ncbi:hypothetical protein [Pseudomonas helleri]|uniref:hypothetical protein n=1 Tax=Pseudomonas helleri TaxID=1608996 RepID=UPI0030D9EB39